MKGYLARQSTAKIISLNLSADKKIISILSNDNSIEFLKILSENEIKLRLIKSELEKHEKT